VRVTPRASSPAVTPSAPDRLAAAPEVTAASTPAAADAPTADSTSASRSGSAAGSTTAPSPGSGPSSTVAPGPGGPAAATAAPGAPSPVEAGPAAEAAGATTRPPRREHADEPVDAEVVEGDTELAGDFLEGLLDAMDVDGDITTWIDERGGHIDLEGQDLDALVGPDGETLDALQELTRLAVLRQTKRRARVFLDVNGFRAHRREELIATATAAAKQVLQTREDHEFQPMTPAERKVVHDAVATIEGARTESLGEEPHRRVVIRPA
jgi:spoIIIJ-associated protein